MSDDSKEAKREQRAELLLMCEETRKKFERDAPAEDWAEHARTLATTVETYLRAEIRAEILAERNDAIPTSPGVRRGRR